MLEVSGMKRALSLSALKAGIQCIGAFFKMIEIIDKAKPDAIVAFGGYVCAPALAAAHVRSVPYFLQEQNTVPGVVNRIFSSGARCTFLGFVIAGKYKLKGHTELTGTPVRQRTCAIDTFAYPRGFDTTKPTVLICGGIQGALSMNRCLVDTVKQWAEHGVQVVWQTGTAGYEEIVKHMVNFVSVCVFESIDDLYPFYATAKLVICRSGASTLAEVAYFGLPCVTIPLPWSAENHQWMNAAAIEQEGWGIRIEQNQQCAEKVKEAADSILKNRDLWQRMRDRALGSSRGAAASEIVARVTASVQR
jgi:UDP-N-acetylglucosamine--N-acetylmuramyl-(pentapeptide) pyrophosphoryl-undecaprenol N-acetylglucosamine transferase